MKVKASMQEPKSVTWEVRTGGHCKSIYKENETVDKAKKGCLVIKRVKYLPIDYDCLLPTKPPSSQRMQGKGSALYP